MGLVPDILADIRLMVNYNFLRAESLALVGGSGCNPKSDRQIAHGANNYPSILRCPVCDFSEVNLLGVVAIHEIHFSARLQPNLVPGVLSQDVEAADVEVELLSFSELPETNTGTD
jgi:hypothetical protein